MSSKYVAAKRPVIIPRRLLKFQSWQPAGRAGHFESATVFPRILPFCWTCKSSAVFKAVPVLATSERLQQRQMFTKKKRKRKATKDDTNNYMRKWKEDHLWESKIYIRFQQQKCGEIKEQFNMPPGLRRKAQDAPILVSVVLNKVFNFSVPGFWNFILLCNLQDKARFWGFWSFPFQSHWECLEIFSPEDSDTVILLEGTPKQGGHRGSCHHPSKAGGILVRIYFQVRANVLCPFFLHASGV